MAKDPAVFSIECDCYSRADVSLPKSKDSSPGAHDTPDLYEVARRLSVQVDAPPWGIDRIDTNGEPAVRRTYWRQQHHHCSLALASAHSSPAFASAAYTAPIVFPAASTLVARSRSRADFLRRSPAPPQNARLHPEEPRRAPRRARPAPPREEPANISG